MTDVTPRTVTRLDGQTERRLIWLMAGRLVLALLSLAIAAGLDGIGRDLSDEARDGIYWTVTLAFLAAVISGTSFGRIREPVRFASTQIAMDVAIVTSLVHFSGGRQSVYTFLYVLVILYGALLFKRRVALGAAALSVMAYGLALITANEGWGLGGSPPGSRIELPRLFMVWLVQGGALFLVGTLASILSREIQRVDAALDRSTSDLNRLQDLYQCTVESIMSGLLTMDSGRRISSFNPEAERITGRTAQEVIGLQLHEVIPGAIESLWSSRGSSRSSSDRRRVSYENARGEALYLGLAESVLRGEDGQDLGHVVIFQDVTEIVAMESDLRRSERLAAVGELSANIAHEIRNPLASISGSIQVLASDQETSGESAKLMAIVVRETDRLNDLITDFLLYARPAPLKMVRVDLNALLEDMIEMFRSVCPANVELHLQIAEGLALEADSEQLRQLLWNLCLNGVQAMPEGGRLGISADWAPRESTQEPLPSFRRGTRGRGELNLESPIAQSDRAMREGARVEIEISDTGQGIPEELLENIFEPFFTTKKEGTGLGLPTVHRIVENHGGELQLKSKVGFGSVFMIRLPAVGTRS